MSLDDLRRWIAPLGLALLHFAWQGLAVALVAWAAMTLARAARLRYAIGCVGLVAMLALPIGTLAWIGPDTRTIRYTVDEVPRVAGEPSRALLDEARAGSQATRVAPTLRERLDRAAPAVVAAWLVGIAALATYHVVGLAQLSQLRRRATTIADAAWLDRVRTLSTRLQLRSRVALLLTDRLDCPAVVGLFRPAILWPAAALTGLTPTQIEALLAHELAHVRRHDYAANLVQTLVETLLFYHPAVWWLSRRVRQEREHCCDDLAANVVGDRATYADALAAMESLRQSPAFALSAHGGSLLTRVQRLLTPTTSRRALSIGRCPLVAILFLTTMIVVLAARAAPDATTMPTTVETRLNDLAIDDPVIARDLVRLARMKTAVRPEMQVAADKPTSMSIAAVRDSIQARLTDRMNTLKRSPEAWYVGDAGEVQRTKQAIADLQRALNATPPPLDRDRDKLEAKLLSKRDHLRLLFAQVGEYYVGGHVQRAGVYSLTARHIALSQAVISAGIDERKNDETWIDVIVRDDNHETTLRFAWSDLAAGRHDDFVMMPNDLIIVGVNVAPPTTAPTTGRVSALDGQMNDRNNRE